MFSVIINVASAAGTDVLHYVPMGQQAELKSVKLIPAVTSAADGTHYYTLNVYGNDGATAVASRATNATALTAGTLYELSLSNTDKCVFSGSQFVKVSTTKASSGKVKDFQLLLTFAPARTY